MRYNISIALLIIFSCVTEKSKNFHLPIYTPADLDPDWVDNSLHMSKSPHFIPKFSFKNQKGKTIDSDLVEGKILAVNYFFTTCPSICPILTNNMKRVQNTFLKDLEVLILSHTVYPEHDSVAVLDAYAELYDILPDNWHLLTGDKSEIYKMARKGHFAVKGDSIYDLDAFIHTENFVLVDKKSRIRGFYNGTNKHEVNRMIEDIFALKNEVPAL